MRLLITSVVTFSLCGQSIDPALKTRIESEALQGQAMRYAETITNFGPRLTLSDNLGKSQDWIAKTLQDLGVKTWTEEYGPVGRAWKNNKISMALDEPYHQGIFAIPAPWSGSTKGEVRAQEVRAQIVALPKDWPKLGQIKNPNSYLVMQKALREKMVSLPKDYFLDKAVLMPSSGRKLPEAGLKRLTEEELEVSAKKPKECESLDERADLPQDQKARDCYYDHVGMLTNWMYDGLDATDNLFQQLLKEAGAVALIYDAGGKNGIMFRPEWNRIIHLKEEVFLPKVSISHEDHVRLQRLVDASFSPRMTIEIDSTIADEESMQKNVFAEIPGDDRDPEATKHIVMLGAHLDSMYPSQGATDNAVGCATILEVIRILKASNFRPLHTIRFAFWSGEEERELGSSAYVKKHFLPGNPEREMFDAYFNLDDGAGAIRGITIHPSDPASTVALFQKWLMPFHFLGADHLGYERIIISDLRPFQEAGLPGFEFTQDPLFYDSINHHTNLDGFEQLLPGDVQQVVAVVGQFIVQVANDSILVPRK